MSAVARTNLFHGQLIELVALQAASRSPYLTAYSAFVLIMEQALAALISEVEEEIPNRVVHHLLAELETPSQPETHNIALRQLRVSIADVGHWLYQWHQARKQIVWLNTQLVPNQAAAGNLIATGEDPRTAELRSWLDGFEELLNRCREQKNYF